MTLEIIVYRFFACYRNVETYILELLCFLWETKERNVLQSSFFKWSCSDLPGLSNYMMLVKIAVTQYPAGSLALDTLRKKLKSC